MQSGHVSGAGHRRGQANISYMLDTCSSIIGINRQQPGKSNRMKAITGERTANFGRLSLECLAHANDLRYQFAAAFSSLTAPLPCSKQKPRKYMALESPA